MHMKIIMSITEWEWRKWGSSEKASKSSRAMATKYENTNAENDSYNCGSNYQVEVYFIQTHTHTCPL